MKTNYRSAPVTDLNPSLVTIAAGDSRGPAISQKETKRTKVRGVGFAFLLAAILGSCVTNELRAQVVVVPNSLATNDGNSSITAGSGGAFRSMLILDASQFGALSGPSFLTQIARRPDRVPGPSGPLAMTYRIYASTTTRSVAGLSATFANNVGTNNTLVFDGTITYTTANLPGPGNTRQFDIVTGFTTAFLYDPAAGNLLLDFQYSSFNGSLLQWDAVTGNQMSSAVAAGGSPTVPTGFFGQSPLYQFTFELPPLVTIRASQVEVCWNSKSNLTYQVQYRSDLTTNMWTSLRDCVRSTGSKTCLTDPVVVGQPQRFYRVAQTNCVP